MNTKRLGMRVCTLGLVLGATLAWSQESTFEEAGVVSELNLANRTLKVNAVSMKASDGLMARVDDSQVRAFSVVRDGAVVGVYGDVSLRGEYIIRGMTVYELPLGIASPSARVEEEE